MLSVLRVVNRRGVVDAESHRVLAGPSQRYGEPAARRELPSAAVRARYQLVLTRATRHFSLDGAPTLPNKN